MPPLKTLTFTSRYSPLDLTLELIILYQKNYQDLEKHAQKIETENNIRRDKIVMLEQDLSYEKAMHTSAATSLANLIEAERARIEDLKSVSIQTMIPTREYETQTEFVVPPV